MSRLKNLFLVFMMVAALAITGCGGGGGGTTAEEEAPPVPTPAEQCVAGNGEWRDGECIPPEQLAAEKAAAELAAALKPHQDSTAASVAAIREHLATARAALSAFEYADEGDENYKAALAAVAKIEDRLEQAEKENERAQNADNTDDAAAAARAAEIREGQAANHVKQVADAITKYDAAEAKANAARGKAMYDALGPPDSADTTAIDNATVAFTDSGDLTIDAITGAGDLATDIGDPALVTLEADGPSLGLLNGWKGQNYGHTDDDGIGHMARVYTNQEEPGSIPLGLTIADGDDTTANAIKGYALIFDGTDNGPGVDINLVEADAFTHSGTLNHAVPAGEPLFIKGTYNGAPGTYRCGGDTPATCSSTNDNDGSVTSLAGKWHFKPDPNAMIPDPDEHYLFFGWWVRNDKNGNPTAASAFHGRAGTPGNDDPTDTDGINAPSTALTAIEGTAKYVGKAVGKFAMRNMLDGSDNGGHFTADAELNAIFGPTSDVPNSGITGTIDNFELNGRPGDPGWSVSLGRGTWGSNGAITAPATSPTVWSINGTKADASGTWSGTMYDESPGDPPSGDGSNVPTTVTGTFYSEFSNRGRMVGAFGANKVDE